MTSTTTSPAHTFDSIKKQYKSLLQRMYAEKGVSGEMKREARELYVEAQLILCTFAFEMRMTSVERREARGKVQLAERSEEKEVIAELQSEEHIIWRRHMVMDAQYVALCHIAKGLKDGFLF